MNKVSDEQLDTMIGFAADDVAEAPGPLNHCRFLALTELRDRRQSDPELLSAAKDLESVMLELVEQFGITVPLAEKTIDKAGA